MRHLVENAGIVSFDIASVASSPAPRRATVTETRRVSVRSISLHRCRALVIHAPVLVCLLVRASIHQASRRGQRSGFWHLAN